MDAKWLKRLKRNYKNWVELGIIDPKAFTRIKEKVTLYLPLYDPITKKDTHTLTQTFTTDELSNELIALDKHVEELQSIKMHVQALRNDVAKKAKRLTET